MIADPRFSQGRASRPTRPCVKCRKPVEALDRFCRACGARVGATPWHLRKIPLLIWLFLLLAPLALPMLWRSDAFQTPAKIVLTVLSFAQLALAALLVRSVYESTMAELMQQLR